MLLNVYGGKITTELKIKGTTRMRRTEIKATNIFIRQGYVEIYEDNGNVITVYTDRECNPEFQEITIKD
jgi:hypothetical protein